MATNGGSVVGGHTSESWFESVNHFARVTPWLHEPARLFANDGVGVFAVLLLVGWWVARRRGELPLVAAALWAPVAALIALGVNQFLAATVDEARPYAVLPHAFVLVSRSTDPSFPSDHAIMAGAVAAGVWLVSRRWGVVTAVLALLMAATRVYVGAHWPLDVVAGLLIGAAVAVASYLLVRRLVERLVAWLATTPVRPLLTASAA